MVANGAANLAATFVLPGDSVVVVAGGGVEVPPESPAPPVAVESEPVAPYAGPAATPARASAIIVARRPGVRLLMISLLSCDRAHPVPTSFSVCRMISVAVALSRRIRVP